MYMLYTGKWSDSDSVCIPKIIRVLYDHHAKIARDMTPWDGATTNTSINVTVDIGLHRTQ